MQVVILAIERNKDTEYDILCKRYLERFVKPWTVKLEIIPAPKNSDPEKQKVQETSLIAKQIKAGDVLMVCDERGKSFTSVAFAKQLDQWSSDARGRLLFAIGGSYGFSAEFLQKYPCIKLSEFTMPHQLARLVLIEQLYRGVSILKGSSYHHE